MISGGWIKNHLFKCGGKPGTKVIKNFMLKQEKSNMFLYKSKIKTGKFS